MPGLKTRKRIKKENTSSPVMMMSAEPSIFRPHSHSDPSSESQSQPRSMANPTLQLKRAQQFGFKLNTSPIQRNTEGTDDSGSSGQGDRATLNTMAAKIVKDIAESRGIQSDDQLGDIPDPTAQKNAGTAVKGELEGFSRNPALKTVASEVALEEAQNSGETLPSLTPQSQSGGGSAGGGQPSTKTMTQESFDAVRTRDRRTAQDYNLVHHEASHQTENRNNTNDTLSSMRNIAAAIAPTGLGQVGHLATGSARTQSQLAAIGSVVFSALDSVLNARSVWKTKGKVDDLEQIIRDVLGQGYDPLLVEAVYYAIQQKYKKIIARSIALVGNLTTLGASAAILATGGVVALLSNPVGWSVLTGIVAAGALIGTGVALWYIGRWIWKKGTGTLGVMRRKMAIRIFENMNSGDQGKRYLAQQAILALMGKKKGRNFINAARITAEELATKANNLTDEDEQQEVESSSGAAKVWAKMKLWNKRRNLKNLRSNAKALTMNKLERWKIEISELETTNDRLKRKLRRIRSQFNPNGAHASVGTARKISRLVRKIEHNNNEIENLKEKRDTQTPYIVNRGGGVIQNWKTLSKLDRNRIKQIERKLKSW